jgi:hypothetical protein
VEHLIIKLIGAFLTFLGDMLIKFLELFPDHSFENKRKRQAKLQLKKGLELLSRSMFEEANIHFGAALTLKPDLVRVLSKRKIRKIMDKLEIHRAYPNARRLWLEMETINQK